MSDKNGSEGRIQWSRFFKKLSPYMIQKGLLYLKHYGPREFWIRLHERFEPEEIPYGPWYAAYVPDQTVLDKQRKKKFAYAPLISVVVPAYRTPELFLRQMIDSLEAQTYENWELCIANGSPEDQSMRKVLEEYSSRDRRVRWQELTENKGIAENTNAAFAMAKGEFVGLLDHDDLLAPNALYEVVNALNQHEHGDAVYTDEDKVTAELDEHFQPHLKPDFNIDLLRSNNYICHFFVVRRQLVEEVGGFRREFDGAQDYDFIFRCVEKAREVVHVPEILYHWRTHKASTADNPASKMYAFEAGKRAIEAHLERTGVKGTVSHTPDLGFYRVKYPVQGHPLVSIIIPNKDEKETLEKCLESIKKNTLYDNYEIIIIENNSSEQQTFDYYKTLEGNDRIKVVTYEGDFNYSKINNYGAKFAAGEYLLLLNNDTQVITMNWMENMLMYAQRPDVGAVGAKLYYGDLTIQHAGIVIGLGAHRTAGHTHYKINHDNLGYMGRLCYAQNVSAVTGACLMVRKSLYEELGGLDESFKVALNDVDFCLRLREQGYLNVFTPFAELYHYESASRGSDIEDAAKAQRYNEEAEHFRTKWKEVIDRGDPYYNPNFSLNYSDYSLKTPDEIELNNEK